MTSIIFTFSFKALNRVKPLLTLQKMSINLKALKVKHDQEANEFKIDFEEGNLVLYTVYSFYSFDFDPEL